MNPIAKALDQTEFAALMAPLGPWNANCRLAIAVSGGPDSLCLAWLAARWGQPLALIVDHGLRPDSAAEAAEAANRLTTLQIPARILTLRIKTGPALAARARAARYEALTQAAREAGLADLLLGHHAGDQAETILIRRQASSGPDGLAGMAAIAETTQLRLVRPLLSIPPARLRATLAAQNIGWAEDPSNANPLATRTQMRARLNGQAGVALASSALADASRNAASRAERERHVASTLARRLSLFPEGHAVLSPGAIEPNCLATLIRGLTGAAYPERGGALARLAADPRSGTLGGLRFMPAGRLGPGTLIVREACALQAPIEARPGAVWDRRFVLQAGADLPPGATLGALGGDSARLRGRSTLPAAVLKTLPALRLAPGGLAVPHIGAFIQWTNRDVRLTLRPPIPVSGAPWRACGQGDVQRGVPPYVVDRISVSASDLPM